MTRSFRLALFCSVFALLMANSCASPPGPSRDVPGSLSAARIEGLYLVGKVWGYLKYHHPFITQGCSDWDAELLGRLADFVQFESRRETLDALNSWIKDLDERQETSSCPLPLAEGSVRSSSSWTGDSSTLGAELSRRLTELASQAVSLEAQHYVGVQSGVGNPVFDNEQSYPNPYEIDWRHRLLALYRFWNVVEYWFPYRSLIDRDFDGVLRTFIPRFFAADTPPDYALELMALLATAQDSHTNLWNVLYLRPPAGPATSPFALRYVEGKFVAWRRLPVSDVADISNAGLQIGDVILAIEDTPVEELVLRWKPYYGASNQVALMRDIAMSLLKGEAGRYKLTVERSGVKTQVEGYRLPIAQLDMRFAQTHDREGETFQELDDEIPYIKVSTIDSSDIPTYVDRARRAHALIIDLRGYPKSFVLYQLGEHLVPAETPFALVSKADLSRPGTFYWSEPIALEPKPPYVEGTIAILVDETTQSQAEFAAMAFRTAPGAVLVGSQTAGADGNVSNLSLPGGLSTAITGIGIFYPDKTPTQQVGIVPDLAVHPTIEGLRAGNDEVLDAAIEYIRDRQRQF